MLNILRKDNKELLWLMIWFKVAWYFQGVTFFEIGRGFDRRSENASHINLPKRPGAVSKLNDRTPNVGGDFLKLGGILHDPKLPP